MSGAEGRADYRIASNNAKATGSGPKVYAVADLKAYLKPEMEEELAAPNGSPADNVSHVVCSCVPVDTCACNTVAYYVGDSFCPTDCPCQCTATCTGCDIVIPCPGY